MNNTDTPQTNAWAHWNKDGDIELVYASISRSLERELNLQKQINTGKEISREVIIEERDELQTEVEKLREQLGRAIEIADALEQRLDNDKYMGSRVSLPIFEQLSKLKAEIK